MPLGMRAGVSTAVKRAVKLLELATPILFRRISRGNGGKDTWAYNQPSSHTSGSVALVAAAIFNLSAVAQTPNPAESSRPGGRPRNTPQDGVIVATGDQGKVTLIAEGATRQQVLNHLFAARDVGIIWRNKVFANEKVYGQFRETRRCVARWRFPSKLYHHLRY
jgi:hypothetical protein